MENKETPAELSVDNIYEKTNIRVIGWTDYDCIDYEDEDLTDEVFFVVARNVRDNGFLFGGNSHQSEIHDCCPVLNTGKAARFSTRNWGVVIAIARNEKTEDGRWNYSLAMDDMFIKRECICRPQGGVDLSMLLPEACGPEVTLEIPAPITVVEIGNVFITAANDETDKIAPPSPLTLREKTGGDSAQTCDEMIKRVIYADTFDALLDTVENEYAYMFFYDAYGEVFGYIDAHTREELLTRLAADYPDTSRGVVALILD